MIDTTFMNSAQRVYQTEICMHVYTSTNWYRILLSTVFIDPYFISEMRVPADE